VPVQLPLLPAGQVLYLLADNLYKVNRTTGVFTLVGPLGANANYGQDAQFEIHPSSGGDNRLYWAAYTSGPQLRLVDTATGSSTVLGSYSSQVFGIGIFGKVINNINETKDINTTVYPNPAVNNITINASNIETIKVVNITGQVIENVLANGNTAIMDVTAYKPGIYFLHINTGEGVVSRKITVNK